MSMAADGRGYKSGLIYNGLRGYPATLTFTTSNAYFYAYNIYLATKLGQRFYYIYDATYAKFGADWT
jgi:hypothetical protein